MKTDDVRVPKVGSYYEHLNNWTLSMTHKVEVKTIHNRDIS